MKMQYLLLKVSICIIIIISIFCDDAEIPPKRLYPYLHNNNGEECFNVKCWVSGTDTICEQYPGTPQARRLPKNSVCFKCLREVNPPSNPILNPPVDKTPTYQFRVDFPDSVNFKYGCDLAYGSDKISTMLSEQRINYFSIKEGGAVKIIITITSERKKMFSSFNLKIKYNNVSFDSVMFKDSIQLFNAVAQPDTVDTVVLYGLNRTFTECPVFLTGVNRSGVENDLVCPGNCDEEIAFLCYREKTHDSLRLYRINHTGFTYPDSMIKMTFNFILKQAIVKISGIIKNDFAKNNWDKNGNGQLDIFPKRDSVPNDRSELDTLRSMVEKDYSSCASCASIDTSLQKVKAFILPGRINENWILMDPVDTGSDSIIVQYSKEIADDEDNSIWKKIDFKLRGWNGSNTETFKINIVKVTDSLINRNRMIVYLRLHKLKYPHLKNDVLVLDNRVLGFNYPGTSCIWVNKTMSLRNLLHEILHTNKFGKLEHANKDSLNIMYPIASPYTQLRYREVEYDNVQEFGNRQWDILN